MGSKNHTSVRTTFQGEDLIAELDSVAVNPIEIGLKVPDIGSDNMQNN